jgi:hypothetical protein
MADSLGDAQALDSALIGVSLLNCFPQHKLDFSRTFQPTTDDGSDHAWGSHHLVTGGAVRGGDTYGTFPSFQLAGPGDADTRPWNSDHGNRPIRRDSRLLVWYSRVGHRDCLPECQQLRRQTIELLGLITPPRFIDTASRVQDAGRA